MKRKEKRKHPEKKFLQQPMKKSRSTRKKLDLKDAPQGRTKIPASTQDHRVTDTSSTAEDFSSKKNSWEQNCKTLQKVPLRHMRWSQAQDETGENSSASEHLSCVSSSSKQVLVDQDGPGSSQMLLNQDLVDKETFFFMPHSHLPSSSTNDPSACAVSTEKKRVMNVYYKPVPMKRGVTALEETEEDLEPPAKMIRIGKIACPEGMPLKASLPCVYPGDTLTGLNREDQEEREEAEEPPEDLAQEADPSVKTAAELENLYSSFRCMGCCQVFPSLLLLKKHLEHGGEEGVSCLNLAFAKLRRKGKKSERVTRKANRNITTSFGGTDGLLRFLLVLAFCSFLFYYYNK